MSWHGFDKSRSVDGTSPSLHHVKSHDKEAIICGVLVVACFVVGWLVGQL
jgi:hypothetical protein